MLKNLDAFYTAVVIFVFLSVVVPLLILVSLLFNRQSRISVNVVAPIGSIDPSYQEVLEQSYKKGDNQINPNFETNNKFPQMYTVEVSNGVLSKPSISIKLGDTVVFKNVSDKPIKVQGVNWGSGEFIPPGKDFAQKFGVRGEFDYTLVGLDSVYGKIQVK